MAAFGMVLLFGQAVAVAVGWSWVGVETNMKVTHVRFLLLCGGTIAAAPVGA